MSITHRVLTACHPRTDRQTERQNQTIEQYLQAFCNYEQHNWVELLPLAEFAYNNLVHTLVGMTLSWAVYHQHPEMQFKMLKAISLKSEIQADVLLEGVEETHRALRDNLLKAQEK